MGTTPYTALRLRREQRHMRLLKLGYRDYPHYLQSPHWASVRAEYRASSTHPQDCICGETEALQLHHMTYERVGAEDLDDLTPLCATCHSMIHTLEARGELGLDFAGLVNEKRAEQRRKEVKLVYDAKMVDWLEDVAFVEDIQRRVEALGKMPKAKKIAGRSLYRVGCELERLARNLDRTQSKHVRPV